MEKEVDVLVVGACTAGLYFAGLMAKQGYRTLVCDVEKAENLGNRFDIIHIGQPHFKKYGLPEPGPGDADYVETFHHSILRSALDKWPKNGHADVHVLRRVPLMKRLCSWATSLGAEIQFETEFTSPVFGGDGRLSGGKFRCRGEEITIKARLTADASGIGAAVRTKLPANYGVENFVTGPRDLFYVILYYVKLMHPETDKPECTTTWPYYKTWLAPQLSSDGAIFGVGANLSFDYAARCFKRFASRVKLPEHEPEYTEQSSTPYRRPPYSFVADGFVALGDAACITNPWSGEGVPYGWCLSGIAAEEFGKAMKNGAYPTQKAAWQVNPRYAKAQGAEFAQNLAMLSGAVNCSPEDNDYEFAHAIIFEDETEKGQGNLVAKLLKGVVTGGISFKALKNLLGAATGGGNIRKHYLAFPENPEGFADWTRKADSLWAKSGSMADFAEKDLATMAG